MKDGAMQSVTFVDGRCVQHTVTRIHHEARRPSRSVQRQDSLGRQVHGVHVENLKNDLRHALSVSLGVQKGVRGQNGMFFRRTPEFVAGRVMPDLLRVAPTRDDTVYDKGAQNFYSALGWRLRSHRGGRGQPRRSTTRSTPRSPRHAWGQHTFEQ